MEDIIVKDANGTVLADGDNVVLTKTLNAKGSKVDLKKGQKIKNIKLTNNPEEVDCRVQKQSIVIKTCYIKKSK